jgi:glyoxylase-like metal-dependent hydrolase (beta-lactamase superfamily II)
MHIDTYTGGLFDTNCFFLPTPQGGILIDAPQGSADWLASKQLKVTHLLITHGHIDHVADAAKIKADHQCRVGYHRDSIEMLTDPLFFRRLGFGWEIAPVEADLLIDETSSLGVEGLDFQVMLVPGHCPGSLCYLEKKSRTLFAGDVLFAGAVGRWDLPGGDGELLMSGIRTKLFVLGDDVRVLPGHGPATTIGRERQTNPYFQGS